MLSATAQVAASAVYAAVPVPAAAEGAAEPGKAPAPAADAQQGDDAETLRAERAAKDAIMRGIDRADAGIEALEQQVRVFRVSHSF